MSHWDKLEGYIRMQGIQDVMDFDRLNGDGPTMARLLHMVKKIDAMCKKDPVFHKFIVGINLFPQLQALVKALQAQELAAAKQREKE